MQGQLPPNYEELSKLDQLKALRAHVEALQEELQTQLGQLARRWLAIDNQIKLEEVREKLLPFRPR